MPIVVRVLLMQEWLSNYSHKSSGISGSYAQIGVHTGLQSLSQTVDHIWRAIPAQLREPGSAKSQSCITAAFLARSKPPAEHKSSREAHLSKEKAALAREDGAGGRSQGEDHVEGGATGISPTKKRRLDGPSGGGGSLPLARSPLKALCN